MDLITIKFSISNLKLARQLFSCVLLHHTLIVSSLSLWASLSFSLSLSLSLCIVLASSLLHLCMYFFACNDLCNFIIFLAILLSHKLYTSCLIYTQHVLYIYKYTMVYIAQYNYCTFACSPLEIKMIDHIFLVQDRQIPSV